MIATTATTRDLAEGLRKLVDACSSLESGEVCVLNDTFALWVPCPCSPLCAGCQPCSCPADAFMYRDSAGNLSPTPASTGISFFVPVISKQCQPCQSRAKVKVNFMFIPSGFTAAWSGSPDDDLRFQGELPEDWMRQCLHSIGAKEQRLRIRWIPRRPSVV